jgi:UTP--glucose-1-phosphate uridylyltransferase
LGSVAQNLRGPARSLCSRRSVPRSIVAPDQAQPAARSADQEMMRKSGSISHVQSGVLPELHLSQPRQARKGLQASSQLRPLSTEEIAGTGQKISAKRPAIPRTELLADPRLDWKLLRALDFDPVRFQQDQQQIALGVKSEQSAIVRDALAPIGDVESVAYSGPRYEEMRALGEAALSRGEVAVVVLNGGMATRFGGVVKGVVDVFDDRSFIELKAQDVLRASSAYGAKIPFVLMNSFQTNDATNAHVLARGRFGLDADQILTFQQSISLRMNPDGSLFIGDDKKPSYHAPGHGDFFDAIKRSGVLAELEKRGIKTVLFSNVDNLGATIDPAIIGHHLAAGAEMTAELVEKRRTASGKWDAGASPVLIGGRARIIEGFRLPPDLPVSEYPDFSTNNFLFSTAALNEPIELERFVVRKKVDDRPALQLESITCEASDALKLHLLRVPRDGEHGRFFPIKEPVDLEAMRPLLKTRLTTSARKFDRRTCR